MVADGQCQICEQYSRKRAKGKFSCQKRHYDVKYTYLKVRGEMGVMIRAQDDQIAWEGTVCATKVARSVQMRRPLMEDYYVEETVVWHEMKLAWLLVLSAASQLCSPRQAAIPTHSTDVHVATRSIDL